MSIKNITIAICSNAFTNTEANHSNAHMAFTRTGDHGYYMDRKVQIYDIRSLHPARALPFTSTITQMEKPVGLPVQIFAVSASGQKVFRELGISVL